MKNLLIAILIGILLINGFIQLAKEFWDLGYVLAQYNVDMLSAMIIASAMGIVLIVVGFVVAISLIGTMMFAGVAVLSAILIAGLTSFWPVLAVIALVVWLVKNKSEPNRSEFTAH
jgi:hypothetical protein